MPARRLPELMAGKAEREGIKRSLFRKTGGAIANYLRYRGRYARMYQLPALRGRLQIMGMKFRRNKPMYDYYAEKSARVFGAGMKNVGRGAIHAGFTIGRPLAFAGKETATWALGKVGRRIKRHPIRNSLLLTAFLGMHSLFTAGSAERHLNFISKHPEYHQLSASAPTFFDRRNAELAGAATLTAWAAFELMRRRLRREGLIK